MEIIHNKIRLYINITTDKKKNIRWPLFRSKNDIIKDILFWTSSHEITKQGRSSKININQLCEDTGLIVKAINTTIRLINTTKSVEYIHIHTHTHTHTHTYIYIYI